MNTVLVVDDQFRWQEAIAGDIKRVNPEAKVVHAYDLADAMRAYDFEDPTVIVCDDSLDLLAGESNRDGLEFIRGLRDSGDEVPIVCLAQFEDSRSKVEGLDVNYVSKTYLNGDLKTALRPYLW